MHFIVVLDRRHAQLFSYDTSSGEQEQLGECAAPPHMLPAQLASMQRGMAARYSTAIRQLLAAGNIHSSVSVILAAHRSLPTRFVTELVDSLEPWPRSECRVNDGGQAGLNEVLRTQLTLADEHVTVAERPRGSVSSLAAVAR